MVTADWCESPLAWPWPGKCFTTGSTPDSASPWAKAPAYLLTTAGSAPNERSPITSSSGWVVTSTTGAKSTVTPRSCSALPRSRASACTWATVMVVAITRALGTSPSSSSTRCTRPPSSSTLTASGTFAALRTAASRSSRSSVLSLPPRKIPPMPSAPATLVAESAELGSTPTMSSCASR